MPIILLLRIILETAVSDMQTAELIEKFKKNNTLFNSFLKNPAGILKTRIFSKTLGKGKLQDELNTFNKNLQTLTNLPVIHKKIMTHITNNNIAKIKQLQKQYLTGQKFMQQGKEIIMDSLTEQDYQEMIGVYVNLTSLALAGGMWVPIIQLKGETYGIATVEFKTSSKTYNFFNIPLRVWEEMVKTKTVDGHGAWSILGDYYYGGLKKVTKSEKQERTRYSVNLLNKRATDKELNKFVVNKSQAVQGYGRYKDYGKQK
ncbi:hypothetical protein [Spiroplasma ixodetis]|uniref:hypothetical protein n=1 Tax=Spiroplasma ixodetis TaxID=2141 RepID=UPI0025765F8E|nr:hypothetical protein [Spiroplasma ixodetis]WJG71253.1 hypothetical protein SIXOD_v1c26300 [Spiroplasma ixodetis Y32]